MKGEMFVFISGIIPASTFPETNSSHLKMDGWKMHFLLGWLIFWVYVSFREGISGSFRHLFEQDSD